MKKTIRLFFILLFLGIKTHNVSGAVATPTQVLQVKNTPKKHSVEPIERSIFTHDAWPEEMFWELALPNGQKIKYCMHEHKKPMIKASPAGMNVFSVCLLRPKEKRNCRALQYQKGLLDAVKKLQTHFPRWILRVYFDASLIAPRDRYTYTEDIEEECVQDESREIWIPLLNKLAQEPNVQLMQYYFPNFAIRGDKHHHLGLFGTVVRFMAAFDPSVNRMFCWDADSIITPELKNMITQWVKSGKTAIFPFSDKYWPKWSKGIVKRNGVPFFCLGGYWGLKWQANNVPLRRLFGAFWGIGIRNLIDRVERDGKGLCDFGFDEILLNQIFAPVFYRDAYVCKFSSSYPTVVLRYGNKSETFFDPQIIIFRNPIRLLKGFCPKELSHVTIQDIEQIFIKFFLQNNINPSSWLGMLMNDYELKIAVARGFKDTRLKFLSQHSDTVIDYLRREDNILDVDDLAETVEKYGFYALDGKYLFRDIANEEFLFLECVRVIKHDDMFFSSLHFWNNKAFDIFFVQEIKTLLEKKRLELERLANKKRKAVNTQTLGPVQKQERLEVLSVEPVN